MEQDLSFLDLVFCVDLTRSMGPFINKARSQMVSMLRALAQHKQAELRVGIAGFRDYPDPVDTHPLTHDLEHIQNVLQGLKVESHPDNTDACEAVFAGLLAATQLEWRPRAYRIMVLVGDAPPHGCGANQHAYPDRYTEDPTGLTLPGMCEKIESQRITLYTLAMLPSNIPEYDGLTELTFEKLAVNTGGTYRRVLHALDAMACVEDIGRRVFGELELDRQVWLEMQTAPSAPAASLGQSLRISAAEVKKSQARLEKRGYEQKPE